MPIYEYRCSSCGNEHEVLQKLSDPPLSVCPTCQKSTVTKLVSAAGFQLKGSGWYATDFKNGGKPAAKPKDADRKSESSETKSDGAKSDGAKSDSAKSDSAKSDSANTDSKGTETKSEAAAPASSGTNCGCH